MPSVTGAGFVLFALVSSLRSMSGISQVVQLTIELATASKWDPRDENDVDDSCGDGNGCSPDLTIDGYLNDQEWSRWSCSVDDTYPFGDECYIYFDLGDTVTLSFMDLYLYKSNDLDRDPAIFEVSTSLQNVTWTLSFTGESTVADLGEAQTFVFPDAPSARYLRLKNVDESGGDDEDYLSICEVEIYGESTGSTPAPVASTTVPEATPAPVAITPAPEVTPAPVARTPAPDVTPAPVASPAAPEVTPAPVEARTEPEATPTPISIGVPLTDDDENDDGEGVSDDGKDGDNDGSVESGDDDGGGDDDDGNDDGNDDDDATAESCKTDRECGGGECCIDDECDECGADTTLWESDIFVALASVVGVLSSCIAIYEFSCTRRVESRSEPVRREHSSRDRAKRFTW